VRGRPTHVLVVPDGREELWLTDDEDEQGLFGLARADGSISMRIRADEQSRSFQVISDDGRYRRGSYLLLNLAQLANAGLCVAPTMPLFASEQELLQVSARCCHEGSVLLDYHSLLVNGRTLLVARAACGVCGTPLQWHPQGQKEGEMHAVMTPHRPETKGASA
jgi:hypothetical protein